MGRAGFKDPGKLWNLERMVSGHLQREGLGAPFICMYCFCGLWPIQHLLTGFFLASEFLLPQIATKVRSWNLGLAVFWFWRNVFENSSQYGFPLIDMSPWPLIIQRTEKQSGEEFFQKPHWRKEGRKRKEKESMTLREEYFSLGRKFLQIVSFFFFKGSVGGYPKRSLIWNVSLPEFQKSGSGYSMNTAGQKQALDKTSAHWNWFPGSWLTLDELQTCFGSHPERPKWTEPFGWRK